MAQQVRHPISAGIPIFPKQRRAPTTAKNNPALMRGPPRFRSALRLAAAMPRHGNRPHSALTMPLQSCRSKSPRNGRGKPNFAVGDIEQTRPDRCGVGAAPCVLTRRRADHRDNTNDDASGCTRQRRPRASPRLGNPRRLLSKERLTRSPHWGPGH